MLLEGAGEDVDRSPGDEDGRRMHRSSAADAVDGLLGVLLVCCTGRDNRAVGDTAMYGAVLVRDNETSWSASGGAGTEEFASSDTVRAGLSM